MFDSFTGNPEVPKSTVREWVLALETFKGRHYEDYSFLLNPLVEYAFAVVSKHGFRALNVEDFNKFIQAFLDTKPETIYTKAEPTITAKFLGGKIKPWVQDIRESLFHSSLPFDHAGDAKVWLSEAREKLDEYIKRLDRRIKKHKEYHTYWRILCEQYPYKLEYRPWDGWGNPPIEHPTQEEMQLLTEEEQQRIISLKPGKSFYEPKQVKIYTSLLDNVRKISEATGSTPESVKMHILTGSLLVLPPFTFSVVNEAHPLPSGVNLLNRYATVTFRGDINISFQDLYLLYRKIRQGLKMKSLKHLSRKNIELYEIVGHKDNIPTERGRAKIFWESKLGEWNKSHPKHRYKTAQVLKITYGRTVARLERMVIQDER